MYNLAYAEMKQTASSYFEKYKERYEKEYEAFKAGKYTEAEFNAWVQTQIARGEGYEKMADKLARRMVKADEVASAYINDTTPSIYSLNHNYEAYRISQAEQVDFHLTNEQTVKALMQGENHTEFKTTSINPKRDYDWNSKKIHTALTSAILQGKSIDKLADSFYSVMKSDRASAMRNARTSFTSAQNAGRMASYEQAVKLGVKMEKEWICTHDERTRDSHADLDGERVAYNDEFSNGLMYPADPSGAPAEVYNCRCTMRAILPNINNAHRETYNEWLKKMQPEEENSNTNSVKNGIIKVSRNYSCDIAQKLGKDYYDKICDIVDSCGNETLIKVWDKYAIGIKVGSTTSGRAFCRLNSIHINAVQDVKGSSWEKPYGVTFHESGHAIDNMARNMGDTFSFYYSSAYNQNEFTKTITEEVKRLVDEKDKILKIEFKEHKDDLDWLLANNYITKWSYDYVKQNGEWGYVIPPKYSKIKAYKAVEDEVSKLGAYAKSDLSDILEGATKGKISCGYGHGVSYWKNADSLATEAFAEMTSATLNNPESLETIKKYLPKSYALYIKMLETLL